MATHGWGEEWEKGASIRVDRRKEEKKRNLL